MSTLVEIPEIKCRTALSSAVLVEDTLFQTQKRKFTSALFLLCSSAWCSLTLGDGGSCSFSLIQVPSSAQWHTQK